MNKQAIKNELTSAITNIGIAIGAIDNDENAAYNALKMAGDIVARNRVAINSEIHADEAGESEAANAPENKPEAKKSPMEIEFDLIKTYIPNFNEATLAEKYRTGGVAEAIKYICTTVGDTLKSVNAWEDGFYFTVRGNGNIASHADIAIEHITKLLGFAGKKVNFADTYTYADGDKKFVFAYSDANAAKTAAERDGRKARTIPLAELIAAFFAI